MTVSLDRKDNALSLDVVMVTRGWKLTALADISKWNRVPFPKLLSSAEPNQSCWLFLQAKPYNLSTILFVK